MGQPETSLEIFRQRPRYGIDLTIPLAHFAFRQLKTVEHITAICALYSQYNLGRPLEDFPTWVEVMKRALNEREHRTDPKEIKVADDAISDLIEELHQSLNSSRFNPRIQGWSGTKRYHYHHCLIGVRMALKRAGKPTDWLDRAEVTLGLTPRIDSTLDGSQATSPGVLDGQTPSTQQNAILF